MFTVTDRFARPLGRKWAEAARELGLTTPTEFTERTPTRDYRRSALARALAAPVPPAVADYLATLPRKRSAKLDIVAPLRWPYITPPS